MEGTFGVSSVHFFETVFFPVFFCDFGEIFFFANKKMYGNGVEGTFGTVAILGTVLSTST